MQDLDGDGQQDAAVLYTTAQSTNVCIAILQRDDTGAWQVRQSVEGLADTVENVRLAQLRAGDDCQLVVGYVAAQGDHYLAVYAYNDGQLSTILEQSYEQYLVEDITGGGSQDLILMSTQEDGGVQIELLTVDKEGGFRQAAVTTGAIIWCWTAGRAFPATIWPACCSVSMRAPSRWCRRPRSVPMNCMRHLCAMCPHW